MYYETAAAHEGFTRAFAGDGGAHEVLGRSFAQPDDKPAWLRTWHRMRLLATPEWVVYQVAYQKNVVKPTVGNWEVARGMFGRRGCPRLVVLKDETNLEKERSLGLGEKDGLMVLDGDHWLHVQEAERFNQIVGRWIDDL